MALVSLYGVRMHFGGPVLLDGVDLKIEPGRKVGIIGRNGVGKSTLLQLITGVLEPTEGSVNRHRGARIAMQTQELEFESGTTVFETMRGAFSEATAVEDALRRVETSLESADAEGERDALLREYERLQHAQEEHGVFDVDQRIRRLLTSLGIPEPMWTRPLDGMSGGERNVIGMARVLLAEPDVMLLDEPTNHLDMDGVDWFIRFIRRTRSAVVMVSHDRHVLDATVDEIWELTGAKVNRWTGNYSDFQRQKAEALALQERQFKVQQRLIARLEFQARRLRDMAAAYDDPGQAKRAKAMLKRVEQMDKVERPMTESRRMGASLAGGDRHGRIALEVRELDFAYGDRVIFDGANLDIEYGERVCLVGPNGSGKSTLFNEILDKGHWENRALRIGKSTKVGEYRQLFDELDARLPLEEWVQRETGLLRSEAQALLHRFMFTREDLSRSIGTLSGGEKSRLQLLRLAHEHVNFLLLDEPTNHLDIQACEQLEEMLQEYDGTLLIISHDRYFLDKLVDRVIEVKDHKLISHPTSFAAWWQARAAAGVRRRGALEDRHTSAARETSGKDDARQAFETRRAIQREATRRRNRVRSLEADIEKIETERLRLDSAAESAFGPNGDNDAGARLVEESKALASRLELLYAEWESLAGEASDEPS